MSPVTANNGKWFIIGGLIILIVGFFLGWFVKPSHKPSVEIKERIVTDTLEVEKPIYIHTQSEPTIVYKDTTTIQAIYDSTSGTKDKVDYQIKYSLRLGEKSNWDISLKPLITTITEYVTKDSIQTVVNTEYLSKPFFLDHWFYVSLILFVTTILGILF